MILAWEGLRFIALCQCRNRAGPEPVQILEESAASVRIYVMDEEIMADVKYQ